MPELLSYYYTWKQKKLQTSLSLPQFFIFSLPITIYSLKENVLCYEHYV